jgi:uncharacterized protein (TIGR02594 family)
MRVTAFWIAQRYVGIKEVPGTKDNPRIMAMLTLDNEWPQHDEVPWCSGFANDVCWLLRLPRSKSLLARSWLRIGESVALDDARVGFDVVVLKRAGANQPGPEDTTAPGHVGFYAGSEPGYVLVLGGNQSNSVSVERYAVDRVLGIRRLYSECAA